VEWTDKIDYTVDARRAKRFYAAIRRYWPGLPDAALGPDYSGIRPKISGRAHPRRTFSCKARGSRVPGLVHLFGIESPGLTASLARGSGDRATSQR
jgi:L-2-hydroxyglutarate oxidase LhgO